MKEEVIPPQNVEQLETADYHDGDFDLGVWEEEIPQMIVNEEDESRDHEK